MSTICENRTHEIKALAVMLQDCDPIYVPYGAGSALYKRINSVLESLVSEAQPTAVTKSIAASLGINRLTMHLAQLQRTEYVDFCDSSSGITPQNLKDPVSFLTHLWERNLQVARSPAFAVAIEQVRLNPRKALAVRAFAEKNVGVVKIARFEGTVRLYGEHYAPVTAIVDKRKFGDSPSGFSKAKVNSLLKQAVLDDIAQATVSISYTDLFKGVELAARPGNKDQKLEAIQKRLNNYTKKKHVLEKLMNSPDEITVVNSYNCGASDSTTDFDKTDFVYLSYLNNRGFMVANWYPLLDVLSSN